MVNEIGHDMTLEEQYMVIPRLARWKTSPHISWQDIEDAAQDVIIYHWRTDRPLPLHFFHINVRQKISQFFKPTRKMAKSLREGAYLSQIVPGTEDTPYADTFPDKVDWEKAFLIREALKELGKENWGRKIIEAGIRRIEAEGAMRQGQKRSRPVWELSRAARTEKHKRRLEEIFEGLL